ncbi:hypothetical protein T484DRAFT_1617352, partial [Baffinella frigidus]
TLNPKPYTPNPAPCTLHPAPYTLNPKPYTLHPTPQTLHPKPPTPNPTPETQGGGEDSPSDGSNSSGYTRTPRPVLSSATRPSAFQHLQRIPIVRYFRGQLLCTPTRGWKRGYFKCGVVKFSTSHGHAWSRSSSYNLLKL